MKHFNRRAISARTTKTLLAGILVAFTMTTTHFACSNRWREASSGKSASEVSELLKSLGQGSAGSGSATGLQKAINLIEQNPDMAVYFAEGPGDMGPLHAVMPIDYAAITGANVDISNIEVARSYFLDLDLEGEHTNMLIVEYQVYGDPSRQYVVYDQTASFPGAEATESEFSVVLKQDNGNTHIAVRTFDIEAGTSSLQPVIQLELSLMDIASGEESDNLGQISSMEGFAEFF